MAMKKATKDRLLQAYENGFLDGKTAGRAEAFAQQTELNDARGKFEDTLGDDESDNGGE